MCTSRLGRVLEENYIKPYKIDNENLVPINTALLGADGAADFQFG